MRSIRSLLLVSFSLTSALTFVTLGCGGNSHVVTNQGQNDFEIGRDSVTSIKGRLFRLADLEQTDTDYVDLSPYDDLLLALLQPSKQTTVEQSRFPRCCELVFVRKDAQLVRITVIWLGRKDPLFYATQDVYAYTRIGGLHPVAEDKWLDESYLLCSFIASLLRKDLAQAKEREDQLRRSVGLVGGKEVGGRKASGAASQFLHNRNEEK